MSIFSSIVKGVASLAAPIIGGAVGGPVGAAIGGVVGDVLAPKPTPPSPVLLPQPFGTPFVASIPPTFPGVGQVPSVPVRQPSVTGRVVAPQVFNVGPGSAAGACPRGYHLDKKTRSYCVKNRRMNVLNGRAASRAIRRIKGARKMLMRIERQMPKARTRRTVRHIPRGYKHVE